MAGCIEKEEAKEEPEPILRDAYSLYILDRGPFEIVGPEEPIQRQFLILGDGPVEISFGMLRGVHLTSGAIRNDIAMFARESIEDDNWLPGCHRWMLDASEITVDGRWYYFVTLLVRRDPDLTRRLTRIQQVTHAREIQRLGDNIDYIVRVYYTVKDPDVYILTLSAPPEDLAVMEEDVLRLLANIRLSQSEAMSAIGGRQAGE